MNIEGLTVSVHLKQSVDGVMRFSGILESLIVDEKLGALLVMNEYLIPASNISYIVLENINQTQREQYEQVREEIVSSPSTEELLQVPQQVKHKFSDRIEEVKKERVKGTIRQGNMSLT